MSILILFNIQVESKPTRQRLAENRESLFDLLGERENQEPDLAKRVCDLWDTIQDTCTKNIFAHGLELLKTWEFQ